MAINQGQQMTKNEDLKFRPNLKKLGADLSRFDELYSFQPIMRDRFIEQANQVLSKYNPKKSTDRYVGFELEYSVVGRDFSSVSEDIRNCAIDSEGFADESGGRITKEVGASQIEIVSDPQIVDGKDGGLNLLNRLKYTENRLAERLEKDKAFLLRMGAHPLVRIAEIENTKNEPKYVHCPRFHEENQRQGIDQYIGMNEAVNARNALIPGITNAVQLNVDCLHPTEAIDIFNRAFMIAPVATVFGANAGFLQGIDTGYADVRYLAWGISHDIRSWGEVAENKCLRVGMPDKYFLDINDYLTHVLSTPFFMESDHAFAMAIGTYWRDARLKFLEKGDGTVMLVVEFRPIATQPTIEEDFAMMMFYLGRVMHSCQVNERRLPMTLVRANKDMAMRLGRAAKLYFCSDDGKGIETRTFEDYAESELQFAIRGLNKLGLDEATCDHVASHLEQRIAGQNPVEKFRSTVMSGGIKKAIRDLNLWVETDS